MYDLNDTLPFEPPVRGVLSFPRSDGSFENHPPTSGKFMYHYMHHLEERNHNFRERVGEYLGILLREHFPNRRDVWDVDIIDDFPEGYKLYLKDRIDSQAEEDLYLYGAQVRFRSTREFAFHAFWILTDPTLDTANCKCKYHSTKSQTELNKQLGIYGGRGSQK